MLPVFSVKYVTTGMGKRIMAIVLSGKRPDGKLQAARGQARIPDMGSIMDLIESAKKWVGHTKGTPRPFNISNDCAHRLETGCARLFHLSHKNLRLYPLNHSESLDDF